MTATAIGQDGCHTAQPRASDGRLARTVGVSMLSLCLALAWLAPAAAQSPGMSPSPSAISARALLDAPRRALSYAPHAGMGTADPPLAAPAPDASATSRFDAAGSGKAFSPATTAAGVSASLPAMPAARISPVVAPIPPAVPLAVQEHSGADASGNRATAPRDTTESSALAPLPAMPAARISPAVAPIPPAVPLAVQEHSGTDTSGSRATAPRDTAASGASAPLPAMPAARISPVVAPIPPAAPLAVQEHSGIDASGNRATAPRDTAAAGASVPLPAMPAAPTAPAVAPAAPASIQLPALAPTRAVLPGPTAAGQTDMPAPTPTIVATTSGPLAPIAQAIAAALMPPESLALTRRETEGLVAFYAGRQGQPAFVDLHGINARGKAVIARLDAAAEDGLDPADYAVARPLPGADAAALAKAELRLATAAMTYARHAQSGRFDPNRISDMVTPTRELPDPAGVLATLTTAADANAALAAFNPPHAGYQALKAKLASLARPKRSQPAAIPAGALIKPGDSDPRVPALRARLGVRGAPGDLTYDPALADAVKAFQNSVRLRPTGILSAATVTALNHAGNSSGSIDSKADIIANMERWRWLPRDLGTHYVWVNIPEFMVRIHEGEAVLHETRIVVGKPETPTPLLSQDMRYAVVNPAWNIPPSIARKEMLPLLRSDPSALARRGIEVVRNGSGGYTFRQSPGERNALGRIKFMFPNDHAVYLHDTPSKTLFANSQRAYSHGCMRVQDPLQFGEVLFGIGLPDENWSAARIGKLFGGKERYLTLKQRIPVHVVYFTTFVNAAGKLETRDDIYGINAEVKARLGFDGARRMADGATTAKR